MTVTGKRREDELLICLYDASPAGVILPRACACTERTPRGIERRSACRFGVTWERPPDALIGLGVPSQKEDVREQR